MNPAVAPQNIALRRPVVFEWLLVRGKKYCSAYANATIPTNARSPVTEMYCAVKNPMTVPPSAAGTRTSRYCQSHWRQYARSASASIAMRSGNRMAAACKGLTTMDMRGTATIPIPPPSPPLAMPTIKTAMVDAT